jgi:hypothetical protein
MGEIRLRRMKYFALRNVKYFACAKCEGSFLLCKKLHYIYFLFFFMPKKRRRMGARSPGERTITIFITSSQNHFSRKKPAVSSAAASTKARARPGRRNDKNTPAPNASASAPTVLHNLLVHLISASRKLYC